MKRIFFASVAVLGCILAIAQPAPPGGFSLQKRNTFPSAANTGIPVGTTLTNYTGSCTISSNNTTIDSKTINCNPLTINAANVTITKSKINGAIVSPETLTPTFGYAISDSEIDCQGNAYTCLNGSNWTGTRVNVYNARRLGYCYYLCTLDYSYLHGTVSTEESGASGFRMGQSTTLRRNTIKCDASIGKGCFAHVTQFADVMAVKNNLVDNNWFPLATKTEACVYGGWTPGKAHNADADNATGISFTNNYFERSATQNCGTYGPNTGWNASRGGNIWSGNKYSPDNTTVAGRLCLTDDNTPGGADRIGGCFPGPGTALGVPADTVLTTYTGSCTVNSPINLDSKIINCAPMLINSGAAGTVITKSYVHGTVIQPNSGSASFSLTDVEIANELFYPACSGNTCPAGFYACGDPNNQTTDCGVGYKNFSLLRVDIHGSNRAAYCESSCSIVDSYNHGTNLWPDPSNLAHASGIRQEQYLTLTHSVSHCSYNGPLVNGEIGCSGDIGGYPDFAPVMHNTYTNNLFMSNAPANRALCDTSVGCISFCVYGGATAGKPYSNDANNATYQVFTGNTWQKGPGGVCGGYGPLTDWNGSRTGNVWTNNLYDDGTAVPTN